MAFQKNLFFFFLMKKVCQNYIFGEIFRVNHIPAPILSYQDTSSWDSLCWNTSTDETQISVSAVPYLKLGLMGVKKVCRSQDYFLLSIFALVYFKISG